MKGAEDENTGDNGNDPLGVLSRSVPDTQRLVHWCMQLVIITQYTFENECQACVARVLFCQASLLLHIQDNSVSTVGMPFKIFLCEAHQLRMSLPCSSEMQFFLMCSQRKSAVLSECSQLRKSMSLVQCTQQAGIARQARHA